MSPSETNWTFESVLTLIDAESRTGVLAVSVDDVETYLHVRGGQLTFVEQSGGRSQDLLETYLVHTRTVRTSRMPAATREAKRTGARLDEVLVEQGVVSPDVMKRFMGLQRDELLYPLDHHKDLKIQFREERPVSPELTTPLPISFVLKELKRRREVWPTLRQRIGRSTSVYRREGYYMAELLGYAPPEEEADDLPELSADAKVVYFFINGVKTSEQLAYAAGLGIHETYAALRDLLDNYLVNVHDTDGKGESPPRRDSIFPRLITLLTYGLLAAMVVFGGRWVMGESTTIHASLTSESPAIAKALEEATLDRLSRAVQWFQLQHERFPEHLGELVDAGYLSADAHAELGDVTLQTVDGRFRLVRGSTPSTPGAQR